MKAKLIYIIVMCLCVICMSGFAKTIYSENGSVSFDTKEYWMRVPQSDDAMTYKLLTVASDQNTMVMLTQGKYKAPYRDFYAMSMSEKEVLANTNVNYTLASLKNSGIYASVKSKSVANGQINLTYQFSKNNVSHYIMQKLFMKDYCHYKVVITGTLDTMPEAIDVAMTMKINGIDFPTWVNN